MLKDKEKNQDPVWVVVTYWNPLGSHGESPSPKEEKIPEDLLEEADYTPGKFDLTHHEGRVALGRAISWGISEGLSVSVERASPLPQVSLLHKGTTR